jgi:hypothetical protein
MPEPIPFNPHGLPVSGHQFHQLGMLAPMPSHLVQQPLAPSGVLPRPESRLAAATA